MTEPEPIAATPSPILDRHEALGAKVVEFAGWLMPIQYSGILEEHRAVRSAAGLFDLSHMGELVVEGPEAGAALAKALISDPPSLAVGRAQYSMICAADGGSLISALARAAPASGPSTTSSPMCDRSNSPAADRTARCSSRMPEYWIGISQPANSTILAPSASCRSRIGLGVAAIGSGSVIG